MTTAVTTAFTVTYETYGNVRQRIACSDAFVYRDCFEVVKDADGKRYALCLICLSNGTKKSLTIQYSDSIRWQSCKDHMSSFHYDELMAEDKISSAAAGKKRRQQQALTSDSSADSSGVFLTDVVMRFCRDNILPWKLIDHPPTWKFLFELGAIPSTEVPVGRDRPARLCCPGTLRERRRSRRRGNGCAPAGGRWRTFVDSGLNLLAHCSVTNKLIIQLEGLLQYSG
jgi:hypothetical protein